MQKPLLTGLALLAFVASSHPSSAQLLAKAQMPPRQESKATMQELKRVLQQFKSHYQVDILFFDRLVEGHFVAADAINWNATLEANLKTILYPLGLRPQKARNQGYIIAKQKMNSGSSAVAEPLIKFRESATGELPISPGSMAPLGLSQLVNAIVVRGKVTDAETNEGIPGANIVIKGSSTGTATDKEGNYQLSVPNGSATLVISFVGYLKQEVAVGDRTSINVALKADNQTLAETVVTGFGDREKRNVGYATTSIDGDAIRRQAAINPISALQGLVPGLQVQPGIGGPQSTPRFLIRGSASLDPYRNQPLIVVDNIVMEQDVVLPNRGGEQDFGNILKDINPDDIESVNVLKGGP